ncbi:hypothetical protein EYF80_021548 [Liparis tanakae]|uniref:Uncharacterized protein n=1 Tax=Liparis tanakae TaxID=230148 RepID=A0A4Z2HQV2_9TELE|nr:hypothetical protein EYF80_021548 [Liparis tanakae]
MNRIEKVEGVGGIVHKHSPLTSQEGAGLDMDCVECAAVHPQRSFQGTLMDANAGLFQIVLQPEPLICQQASLHGLPVLRKCKSPPYRHL